MRSNRATVPFAAVLGMTLAAPGQPAAAAQVDWGPTQQVSLQQPLGPPDVAVGPRTGTAVVWTADGGGFADVRFRQRTPDGVWHRVRSLGRGGGPQVGMDGRGNAITVWHRTRPGRIPEIVTARRRVDGTWSARRVLSRTAPSRTDVDTATTDLHLAVSTGGAAVAVWRWGDDQGDGPEPRVQAAYRPAGGRWHGPTDLTRPGVCIGGLDAAIGPRGNAVVVCSGSRGVRAIRHVGSRWTAPVVVATGSDSRPDVAIGAAGGTAAVWGNRTVPEDGGEPTYTIETSRLSRSWSAPVPVTTGGQEHSPQVAVSEGMTTVVWRTLEDAVQSARRTSWSAPFGAPQTLSAPAVMPSPFGLEANTHGDLVVAWTRVGAQGDEKVAVTRPADGDWTDPVVLSEAEPVVPEEEAVGVAMGRCGRAFVAWQDTRTRLRNAVDCTR